MTLAPCSLRPALGFEPYLVPANNHPAVAMLTSKGPSGITGAGLSRRGDAAVVGSAFGARHGYRSGHRQVHERMSRPDQPLRQRCRVRGGVVVGGELDPSGCMPIFNKQIDPSDMETAITTG